MILLAQINEQKTTLNQQSSFVDKVMGDKKNLVTKKTTLDEQVYTYISTFIHIYKITLEIIHYLFICVHMYKYAQSHIHKYTHMQLHIFEFNQLYL